VEVGTGKLVLVPNVTRTTLHLVSTLVSLEGKREKLNLSLEGLVDLEGLEEVATDKLVLVPNATRTTLEVATGVSLEERREKPKVNLDFLEVTANVALVDNAIKITKEVDL